jgi:hypothetical protein
MYAATTKDEGNAADGRFSTACKLLTPWRSFEAGLRYIDGYITVKSFLKNGADCLSLRHEGHTKTSNWRQKCHLNSCPSRLTNTRSFSWEPDIEKRLFGNPKKIARPQLRLLPQCQVVSEPTSPPLIAK